MIQADPARLVLEYTRRMMGFLLLHPAPKRIAMIGLGGGSLAKYCAWKLPDADFTAIEISPQVIELRETFGIPPDGPRFRILREDGAEFVRREGKPLDVLLVDGFDRGGQPDDLCSAAFYDYCRDALADGGVLAVNSYGDGPGDDVRLDRLRDAFGGRVVFVDVDGSENRVMFAGTSPSFPPTFAELVERLRALEASHPVGLDVTFRKILQYTEPRNPGRRRRRLLGRPDLGLAAARAAVDDASDLRTDSVRKARWREHLGGASRR